MKTAILLGLFVLCALSTLGSSYSLSRKTGRPLSTQGGEDPDPEIQFRRNFVKQMMNDSWHDYVRYAWGNNELKPVSQTGQTGGIFGTAEIGATIVDSLDTLFIMEMMDEYETAREFVENQLNFTVDATVSVFETNIRFVGGFLTAYALTQDTMYRDRALEIATKLLPAFDTPSGIPYSSVNILTGVGVDELNALAGFGTLHLEFMYLSDITGNPVFREKVQAIRKVMKDIEKPNGQYWNFVNVTTGEFTGGHVSIGGLGDSFYEYLLKAYIQLGDEEALEMYNNAMDAFFNNGLVKVSNQSHLVYIAESRNGVVDDVVGHLACFAGGMFALGAHVNPNGTNAERDADIGKNFTNTCHESYIRTKTRIGPETFRFSDTLEAEAGSDGDRHYILRPEVLESYMILYRLTGDSMYREWAWDAAQAIEKYTKVRPGSGYSGIRNTNSETPEMNDVQETFFLAETLKYLYLIFSTNDLISLDEWVFNTECHPLPIKAANSLY